MSGRTVELFERYRTEEVVMWCPSCIYFYDEIRHVEFPFRVRLGFPVGEQVEELVQPRQERAERCREWPSRSCADAGTRLRRGRERGAGVPGPARREHRRPGSPSGILSGSGD